MSREDDIRMTIGGGITTATVVRQALTTLQAGNPLASMDYHGISGSVLQAHPEMDWPNGRPPALVPTLAGRGGGYPPAAVTPRRFPAASCGRIRRWTG